MVVMVMMAVMVVMAVVMLVMLMRVVMVVVMVVMWMILATCSGLDDVLVMVDDPVTEVRNLLACLGHLLGLVTLGSAGVERSRQILIGGALRIFHRLVVLVEGQTKP